MNLRNLDILRALLALIVLAGHARGMLWMPWHEWRTGTHAAYEWLLAVGFSPFTLGAQAVAVFFVLSGFFIHLRAASAAVTPGRKAGFSTADYFRRRALRILPPYYACLAFVVVIDSLGRHFFSELYLSQTSDAWINDMFKDWGFTPAATVPALLAQPGLLWRPFGSNTPLWSICSEVVYYTLYPVFMALWLRSRPLAYGLLLAFSMASWFRPLAGWWTPMIGSYPLWLAGALLAEVFCARPHLWSRRGWFAGMLALAGCALAFQMSPLPGKFAASLVLSTACVSAFLCLPERAATSAAGRFLEWAGVRSYSIYIFHYPVITFVAAVLFHTAGARPSAGWWAAAGALLSLLAGLGGFWLVEARFLPRRMSLNPAA